MLRVVSQLSPGAIRLLMAYNWPGNVRELENCMERAVLTASSDCIHSANLPPSVQAAGETSAGDSSPGTLAHMMADFERGLISDAISRNHGNLSAAGRELGLSPRMMNYRMQKLGITRKSE